MHPDIIKVQVLFLMKRNTDITNTTMLIIKNKRNIKDNKVLGSIDITEHISIIMMKV